MSVEQIQIKPFSPALGAEVRGINLANGIDYINEGTKPQMEVIIEKDKIIFSPEGIFALPSIKNKLLNLIL